MNRHKIKQVLAALIICNICDLLTRRLQRVRRLEKQAEEDIIKARKNAKIEQYLKIVDARGQVNKRKMIERWLQHVEAERTASPMQINDTKTSLTKVMKQQPVRRSARLKSKKQSNETERSA